MDILIGDADGQHVILRPLGRGHPGLFEDSDGNWITCELQISAGGFRGHFRADLRSEEFLAFLEELASLRKTLEGRATFSTIEGQIGFSLIGDEQGHVRVEGDAVDVAGTGNRLHFGFEIDQTYLPPLCRSLEAFLSAFPVTGTTEA
ncbi:MAG: hypothetical protein ABJA98_08795 [Acidobacteriota bacterium]